MLQITCCKYKKTLESLYTTVNKFVTNYPAGKTPEDLTKINSVVYASERSV